MPLTLKADLALAHPQPLTAKPLKALAMRWLLPRQHRGRPAAQRLLRQLLQPQLHAAAPAPVIDRFGRLALLPLIH